MSNVTVIINLDDGTTVSGSVEGPDVGKNLQAAVSAAVTGLNARNVEAPAPEPEVKQPQDRKPPTRRAPRKAAAKKQ